MIDIFLVVLLIYFIYVDQIRRRAIKNFVNWFEDTLGFDDYLHELSDEEWELLSEEERKNRPNGSEWRSYSELPEFKELRNEL